MHMNSTVELTDSLARRSTLLPALLMLAAFSAPLLIYFDTAKSAVAIWYRSETFAHGFIILPICLWLIWRRRENFYQMPPTLCWRALPFMAIAGMLWSVAGAANVSVLQQYSLVLMLPITALALFGRRLAFSLAFPLLFLLAAVPFGEIFVDSLISFTADFTVACLQLVGIPVLRNGTLFEIPSGSWSVVEACSGVRYLISSVTIGCLYAYLTYRSNIRRAMFIGLAVIVPIIANGLRAFMIVMIGHLSGMRLAVGVDHLIYGWLFFGLVMFLMFWIGNFWREDEDLTPVPTKDKHSDQRSIAMPANGAVALMTAALIAIGALWPAIAAYGVRLAHNPHPVQLVPVAVNWPVVPPTSDWHPSYMPPDARFEQTYRSAQSTLPVNLQILYYRNQTLGKSLIGSMNQLAAGVDMHQTAIFLRKEPVNGEMLQVREGWLKGPNGKMLVWHWNWIDGQPMTSNAGGKARQALARLAGRSDDGAAIMLAASYDENPEQARAALRAFVQANLAPLNAALATTRAR